VATNAHGGAPCGLWRADLIYTINSILLLYSWIVAAILISFLFLIGRFYEIKFGQKSYYLLMLVPLGCYLAAAVWYVVAAHETADFLGVLGPDLLLLVGGAFLIVLCYHLYRTMMGGGR
jgi:hypothetical protein